MLLATVILLPLTTQTLAQAKPTPCSTCGGYWGAPGPIVGAGLPVLAIAGCGVYWLLKRRRKTG
jgi:hypothetical protein